MIANFIIIIIFIITLLSLSLFIHFFFSCVDSLILVITTQKEENKKKTEEIFRCRITVCFHCYLINYNSILLDISIDPDNLIRFFIYFVCFVVFFFFLKYVNMKTDGLQLWKLQFMANSNFILLKKTSKNYRTNKERESRMICTGRNIIVVWRLCICMCVCVWFCPWNILDDGK